MWCDFKNSEIQRVFFDATMQGYRTVIKKTNEKGIEQFKILKAGQSKILRRQK